MFGESTGISGHIGLHHRQARTTACEIQFHSGHQRASAAFVTAPLHGGKKVVSKLSYLFMAHLAFSCGLPNARSRDVLPSEHQKLQNIPVAAYPIACSPSLKIVACPLKSITTPHGHGLASIRR